MYASIEHELNKEQSLHFRYAPVAREMSVLPLSKYPTSFARIGTWADPYVMVALIPQYMDAGGVAVTELKRLLSVRIDDGAKATYVHAMEPVYLVGSVPPKVSSPTVTSVEIMGWNERLKSCSEMIPWV